MIQKEFFLSFGKNGGKDELKAFKPSSKYLHELLFFFSANDQGDIPRLVQACKFLHQFVQVSDNLLDIFTNGDYHCSSNQAIIQYRVKRFAFCCLQAVHQNIELLTPSGKSTDSPGLLLLQIVISLIDSTLPWAGNTMDYISQRYTSQTFPRVDPQPAGHSNHHRWKWSVWDRLFTYKTCFQ